MIHSVMLEMLLMSISINPELFLFNIMPDINDSKMKHITIHIVTAARILFVKLWERMETPTKYELWEKIHEEAEMDILTETLRDKNMHTGKGTWKPSYKWIEN